MEPGTDEGIVAGVNLDSTADEEGHDWDEYEDEIASAVAFASWQELAKFGWEGNENETDTITDPEEAIGCLGLSQDCGDWHSVDYGI